MYIIIDNEYVPVNIASDILNIPQSELTAAGHTVQLNEPSAFTYKSNH